MQARVKFDKLSPWQELILKVRKDHPEYKSNRQRIAEAKRIWLTNRPVPSPRRFVVRSKWNPPPPPKEMNDELSEWQKHYYTVFNDNPKLITVKAKYKFAKQLWLVEHGSDRQFEDFLKST